MKKEYDPIVCPLSDFELNLKELLCNLYDCKKTEG